MRHYEKGQHLLVRWSGEKRYAHEVVLDSLGQVAEMESGKMIVGVSPPDVRIMSKYLCSNDDGTWYGLFGHHKPADLFRAISRETGYTLDDLEMETLSKARTEFEQVRQGYAIEIDRDKPETWTDHEQESMDDGYWPHDYDSIVWTDESGTVPMTWWTP